MASPKIKFKRSSVASKSPSLANIELGEVAMNTFDGDLYIRQDQSSVGIATTVVRVNPWNERGVGVGVSYSGDVKIVGILTVGSSSLTLNGSNNTVNVGTALTLGHSQGLQFHTQNLHSTGFEVNNINASGVITATTFVGDFNGNVHSTGISTISGFRFPTIDGSEDQSLVTDGNGVLSFKTISGGSAVGSATTISAGITTATQGQTVFTTPHPHNDGTNTYSVQVFLNGVKQRPSGAGATKDFTASSNSTITFEEGITVGSEVVSVIYYGHTIDEEYFTATQGQVLYSLSGNLSALKNFRVFINGVKLRNGTDFAVAAPVILTTGAAAGAHLEIVCDNAEDAFTASDQQTNFNPTSADLSDDNMQVYLNGIQLFKGIDYTIGSPSVTLDAAVAATVGDELDVCVRRS